MRSIFLRLVLVILAMNVLCYYWMDSFVHQLVPHRSEWRRLELSALERTEKLFSYSRHVKTNLAKKQSLGTGEVQSQSIKLKPMNLQTIDQKTADMLHRASLLMDDLILSPPPCEDSIYLLIMVISSAKNFNRRTGMRDSIKVRPYRGKSVRFVFVTARADDQMTDAKLHYESLRYRDIILTNHKDAYRNMTYKALETLKWKLTKCQHAKFLLKMDDDVLVIYENIVDYAIDLELKNLTVVYAGMRNNVKVVRDPKSKWYMSHKDYANDTLPPYISGYAILFSQVAVREIYRASFHVSRVYKIPRQTFPIDDAFIGICAHYAKIKLTKMRWACLVWNYLKHAVTKEKCILVKLKVVHQIPGYRSMKRYLKWLQTRSVHERNACRKKDITLTKTCFW
ncbi:beta-1,3-galactosyltransferase 1-like [Lineus longissimus]|uniref:beta-1,3-galactosyltransferase 1-like n=1 Tax=Lineus longissimus TaxID=88925 RepID=UPI00315DF0DC